jgi:hypothetical protein
METEKVLRGVVLSLFFYDCFKSSWMAPWMFEIPGFAAQCRLQFHLIRIALALNFDSFSFVLAWYDDEEVGGRRWRLKGGELDGSNDVVTRIICRRLGEFFFNSFVFSRVTFFVFTLFFFCFECSVLTYSFPHDFKSPHFYFLSSFFACVTEWIYLSLDGVTHRLQNLNFFVVIEFYCINLY